MYFQVFSFCWSTNEILIFLSAAVVLAAGLGFTVPWWFILAAFLAAAVSLLISFGFVPRNCISSNFFWLFVANHFLSLPFVLFLLP